MTTYIIYAYDEPRYKIEADFYDVEHGFVSFYDNKDNLIGSFNADEIDFITDLDRIHNVAIIDTDMEEDKETHECCDCKEKHENDNFDELFKRVIGIHVKD